MRVGFVCPWEPGLPEATWSRSPWSLRESLAGRVELVDIDPGLARPVRAALKLAYYRKLERGWSSTWKWSRAAEALVARKMWRASAQAKLDLALEMGDYGAAPVPFFLYQDVSF